MVQVRQLAGVASLRDDRDCRGSTFSADPHVSAGARGTLTFGNDGSQEAGILHPIRNHTGNRKVELIKREFNPGDSVIAENNLIRNLTVVLRVLPDGPPAVQSLVIGIFQEKTLGASTNAGNTVKEVGDDRTPTMEVFHRVFALPAKSADSEVRKGVDGLTCGYPFFKLRTKRCTSCLNADSLDRGSAEEKRARKPNVAQKGDSMMAGSVRGIDTKGSEGRFLIPSVVAIARKPGEVRKMSTQGLAKGAGSGRNLRKPQLNSTTAVIIATVEPEFQNGISHQGLRGRAKLSQPAKFIPV